MKRVKILALISLGIIFLSFGVVIIATGQLQKSFVILDVKLNYSKEEKPYLYITPQNRTLNITNFKTSTKLKLGKLSLSVPWEKPTKTTSTKIATGCLFKNKKSVAILKTYSEVDYFKQHMNESPNYEAFLNMYKRKNLQSDYIYNKCIYDITPDKISLFDSYKDVKFKKYLLDLKKTEMLLYRGKIYNYKRGSLKGFEHHDSTFYMLTVYGAKDQEYNILIGQAKYVTQNEIDYILNSIQIAE